MAAPDATLRCHPMTPARWDDLDALMSGCGDARICWCAFWRRPHADFQAGKRDGANRAHLRAAVESGAPTGVVGYRGRQAIAWCAIAPRVDQGRLARSRVLAPVDDAPVWSITCFVVARGHRRGGLMRPLIAAAVDFARKRGAAAVEAYPIDPQRKVHSGELFVGLLRPFLDQGFHEVARRSPARPIVRLALPGKR